MRNSKSTLYSASFLGLTILMVSSLSSATASPLKSTLPGMEENREALHYLGNSHAVAPDATPITQLSDPFILLRSKAPSKKEQLDYLKDEVGVKRILVFKEWTPAQARARERMIELYDSATFTIPTNVTNILFKWKGITDFKESCLQTIDGLKVIKAAEDANERILLHCTHGEDRTGYLSAMYRLLKNPVSFANFRDIWKNEMCEHGYSSGNGTTGKLIGAAPAIDHPVTGLTPLFLKMYSKIEDGTLNWETLNPEVCESEPSVDAFIASHSNENFSYDKMKCEKSSLMIE